MKLTINDLSAFTRAYIEAMLFTECSAGDFDPENGSPLPKDTSFDDFAPETLTAIIEDCAAFELNNRALLDQCGDAAQNGHDFWLTRNHHGAGFWDRDYPEDIGEAATKAAQAFGEVYPCFGDDGKVYLS